VGQADARPAASVPRPLPARFDSGGAGLQGQALVAAAAIALAASLGAGCQGSADVAVLLELRAPARISKLSVLVKRYLPDQSVTVFPESVNEIDESTDGYIGAAEGMPLRLNIELPASGRYAVHVVGLPADPTGDLAVASVCRDVDGVVFVGGLWLGRLPGELDVDGDSFPEDAEAFCGRQTAEGIGCEASCNTAQYLAMADCNPPGDLETPEGCAEPGAPADWNPMSPDPCGDCHDQDCWHEDAICPDLDGDGSPRNLDCNDDDPEIHPGADEICGNGVDENCAVEFDECEEGDLPCDLDGDGFAGELTSVPGCGNDCDDDDPSINPGAHEGCGVDPADPSACLRCDGVDNNCNGRSDEGCFSDDLDGDGAPAPRDCDDCNVGIGPDATEACDDGVDQDCSGGDLACAADDQDHDGVVAESTGGTDCDDADPHVYAGAPERCGDGIAQDCLADQGCATITDSDGDGFGLREADCDDGRPTINPWAAEACDLHGLDEDCDGLVNEVDGPDALDRGCVSLDGERSWEVVNYRTNPDHCGGCRQRCCESVCSCAGDSCVGGVCTCAPAGGLCDGGAASYCCADGCVDLGTDLENCGGCGVRCAPGEECRPTGECGLGACVCEAEAVAASCPQAAGSVCCPDVGCTNIFSDPLNCGACGNDCTAAVGAGPVGDACVEIDGAGVCSCGGLGAPCTGTTWCTHVTSPNQACGCRDLRADPNDCGTCGVVCDPASEDCCDRVCVDVLSDTAHCGAPGTGAGCANACVRGEVCDGGVCRCADATRTRCGDSCDCDTAGGQICCDGECFDGWCCTDDDCGGDQNPDCNGDDHQCYCRGADGECGGWNECCSYGCYLVCV
jgi:hypothetical protein